MTDQVKDFSPETVLAAVAKELRYNRDDLVVEWDETVEPRCSYEVLGKGNKMRLVVYRSEADVQRVYENILEEQLISGTFLSEFSIEQPVFDAVVKVCNLADLTPYLTMSAREGWALPSGGDNERRTVDPAIENATSIVAIRLNQAALLDRWLKDPVAAVWRLQGGDLPSILAVLIEQCSFDVGALVQAIMRALGGWRAFQMCSVVAMTSEGFVVIGQNPEALDYLEELFEATKHESTNR